MLAIIVVFSIVFVLNVIPAFAPPTWLVFSFIGFRFPDHEGIALALAGALGATLGRVTLAKLSRVFAREHLLTKSAQQNVDEIRGALESRRKLTFGVLLFYAFSPLPSNYVFIAYGLTTMDLKLIAVPFFLGRAVSYTLWGKTFSALGRILDFDGASRYFGAYFVASQIVFLYLVYLFTRVDWRTLLTEKKFRWIPKGGDSNRSNSPEPTNGAA